MCVTNNKKRSIILAKKKKKTMKKKNKKLSVSIHSNLEAFSFHNISGSFTNTFKDTHVEIHKHTYTHTHTEGHLYSKGPSRPGRFCIPFTDAKPARDLRLNHLDGDGRKN